MKVVNLKVPKHVVVHKMTAIVLHGIQLTGQNLSKSMVFDRVHHDIPTALLNDWNVSHDNTC